MNEKVRAAAVWVVHYAAARLPSTHRERYEQEWLGELAAVPPRKGLQFAISVAWYVPAIRLAVRESSENAARRRSGEVAARDEKGSERRVYRRYRLQQQLGRLIVIGPVAMVPAAIGGIVLQSVGAPAFWFYAYVIALGAGACLQIVARGSGLPGPATLVLGERDLGRPRASEVAHDRV